MPNVNVKGSGDFNDLTRSIQNAAKAVADLGLKLSGISAAGKAFDAVTGAIGGTVNALGKIGLAAQGVEALGKSAVSMGMGLLKGNAQLEMTTISFKTLLGSASAAQDMIKQLTTFAETTPFELTGLEANTQRLLAFGFEAKDIIPLMTSMGDAISALGGTQENLNSLVYVMGQMRQEAHINAGDIMQMVNLGIPALQMLADHYHVTTGEIQQMISKGLIPGKDAVAIFTSSLETQYGGMMAAQSQTFSGMLSNMQDWAHATMIILAQPLFQPAKDALQKFLDFTSSPAGQRAVEVLAGYIEWAVKRAVLAFTDLYNFTRMYLLPILDSTWQFFDKYIIPVVEKAASRFGNELLTSVQLVKTKFDESLPTLEAFYKKVEPIVTKALELYKALSPLSIAFDVLKGILNGGLQGGWSALEKHIVDAGKVLGLNLQPAMDWFTDTIVKNVIPTLQMWANTFINDWWPKIQKAVGWASEKIGEFADIISKNVWPPVSAFLGWLGDQGKKIWDSFTTTLNQDVIPAVKTFFHWVAEYLWPKLRDEVFPWIDKNVRPKLEKAFDIIATDIIPGIGKLVDTILNHVIPTLVAWWSVLAALISPFLKNVGDVIDKIVLPALDKLFGASKDNKKGIDGIVDGFKNFLGIVDKVVDGFHKIWEIMGGWLVENVIDSVGKIITMLGLMGDAVGALQRGDWQTAFQDMLKVKAIWNGEVNISGNGGTQYQTSADRLKQYIATHPGYDPVKAGNAHAGGTTSAPGGLALIGEKGMELVRMGNKIFLATSPMLLNLPKGAEVYNNAQTRAMLPNPASPQQISNMYATSYANRSWDYSQNNSHNSTQNYYINGQQSDQWSFGQSMKWYAAR